MQFFSECFSIKNFTTLLKCFSTHSFLEIHATSTLSQFIMMIIANLHLITLVKKKENLLAVEKDFLDDYANHVIFECLG